ncbi:uncharacterized protein LOC118420503 [Branchiostoma floridae]|uniref:Uncharacterized protein LOC118420503 n=1 Tax=Branchiostoma floridae TaxID=7739 RepID=C3XZI1_BRAFL|nr:uncharacterized protein LOC118420503 [Branchiostoma floridae]|eukprot:XP_002610492.1 hypothetical protein BRAFLDRAFT_117814 [Branchiostoma floridae]
MSDDKWHWMRDGPPKKDAQKGFFSSLADAVRGKGPSPDKASRMVTSISKVYALGAWTLCVAAGVHWYYHRKDKPISDDNISSTSAETPDKRWEKKTIVGTFTYEQFRPSDTNPNKLRLLKWKIIAKLDEWWNGDANVDKRPADQNKGTT